MAAEAEVAVGHRVAEGGQLPAVRQHAGNKVGGQGIGAGGNIGVEEVLAVLFQADIDMQAVSGLAGQGLGHEAGVEPVAGSHALDHIFKGDHIVGGFQGGGVHKVHLVLAVSALVVAVGGA